MIRCLLLLAIVALSQIDEAAAFVTNSNRATTSPTSSSYSSSTSFLLAKKKNKNQAGKGFGKEPEKVENPASTTNNNGRTSQMQSQQSGFTSVDGGSDATPTLSMGQAKTGNVEDRTGSILREKYGLRTRDEQEAEEAKQKQRDDQRKKLNEWKKQAELGQDFDWLEIIPDPILIFIDKFLKVGVSICTFLFLLSGVFITIEAGSKALDHPLPPWLDDFVANVVEPNFTPGLGVLLGFSVGLGIFASLQLNSAASTYKENK